MSGRPSVKEGVGMKSQFADLNLELVSHKAGEFSTDDNIFDIKIKSPNPIKTTYNLHWCDKGEEKELPNGVLTHADGDTLKFKLALPSLGWYKLNIFAMPEDGTGSLPCVYTYLFDLTKTKKPAMPYPKQFADWRGSCHLYEPKFLDTSKDLSKVKFKVRVPGARKVAVKARDEWTQLRKSNDDDQWEGDVCLEQYKNKGDTVNLNACMGSDETSYATLLQFSL